MYSKKNRSVANEKAATVSTSATLAIQLNSGDRLIHDFNLDVSLKDVLDHWNLAGKLDPPLSPAHIPVCLYLRKEVAGDELATSTLRQIGIVGGKVAIRYLTRSTDAPREQAHVGGVLAPTIRPPTPEDVKPKKRYTEELSAASEPEKQIKDQAEQLQELNIPVVEPSKENKSMDMEMSEDVPETKQKVENVEIKKSKSVAVELAEIPASLAPVSLLNERGDLIFSMDDNIVVDHSPQEDLPEDFFELSVDELRKRMRELRQQCAALNEAPLVTAEHRQAQKQQRNQDLLEKYPVTVLRVQFSDRLILQLPLPSQTLILQVMEEVASYLEGSPNYNDFYLFTSPPKVLLEKKNSLLELGLTPTAVVYIGCNNSRETTHTIKAQHRQKLSSHLGAMREVAQRIVPSYSQQSTSELESSDGNSNPAAPAKRSTASVKSTNVPKWFKMQK